MRTCRIVSAPLSVALLVGLVLGASRPKGEDVHRADSDCQVCHTADASTLQQDPAGARTRLAADLEARCAQCHGDEGLSHPTGGVPTWPVPATLPLSPDGRVTCATCHFIHGESNVLGDLVRIDNRHGGLCLTCHQPSELNE